MKHINKRGQQPINPEDHPLYHSTWKLLKNYRDVVWSLELAVQQVRCSFEAEFGESIEDFLDSLYLAGADLAGTQIENHARSIERSRKMLRIVDSAVALLRNKHKNLGRRRAAQHPHCGPERQNRPVGLGGQFSPHQFHWQSELPAPG